MMLAACKTRLTFALFAGTISCLVGAIASAQAESGPFDGRWSASVGAQGGCNFTSLLIIDVVGSSLFGNATNPFGVFPLTGTVDPKGKGVFKIGKFAGTIRFSNTTFEANYANNCGGRFASGRKVLGPQTASTSTDPSTEDPESRSAPATNIVNGPVSSGAQAAPVGGIAVPLQKQGGTYALPVLINSALTLNFVVDSGASDVSIPSDVVLTLVRTGTVRETDFLGDKTYMLADGSTRASLTFRIRSLRVGDKIIENVTASVAPVKGELLLGQSFLSRFKTWSIDNNRHTLILVE
jgi:clan AA aspartic protease (TIGR02281 family)